MIVVGLLAAGLAALVLGVMGSDTGLLVLGPLWIAVSWGALRHARRLRATERSEVKVSTILAGAATLLAGGVPALVIGLVPWQIDDPDLRWLPIVVGGILTAFALLTAGMFLLGTWLENFDGDPPTIPATIVIVSAAETGTFINDRPRIEFVLDVTPDGQSTYRVTKKATVPMTALGSIRPGDGFRARVAGPQDPTAMAIEWSASLPGA